jgi:hypothetical protein
LHCTELTIYGERRTNRARRPTGTVHHDPLIHVAAIELSCVNKGAQRYAHGQASPIALDATEHTTVVSRADIFLSNKSEKQTEKDVADAG